MKSVKSIFQVLLGPISVCILLISTPIGYASPPSHSLRLESFTHSQGLPPIWDKECYVDGNFPWSRWIIR